MKTNTNNTNIIIDESNRAALELITSDIKARLHAVQKHADKYHAMGVSAGILLIDLKKQIPHGGWQAWLKEHGIHPRTAQDWMLRASDPEKYARRKRDHAIYEQEIRDNHREWEEFKNAACHAFTEQPKPRVVRANNKPNQPRKTVIPPTELAIIHLVRRMTANQQELALALLSNPDNGLVPTSNKPTNP